MQIEIHKVKSGKWDFKTCPFNFTLSSIRLAPVGNHADAFLPECTLGASVAGPDLGTVSHSGDLLDAMARVIGEEAIFGDGAIEWELVARVSSDGIPALCMNALIFKGDLPSLPSVFHEMHARLTAGPDAPRVAGGLFRMDEDGSIECVEQVDSDLDGVHLAETVH